MDPEADGGTGSSTDPVRTQEDDPNPKGGRGGQPSGGTSARPVAGTTASVAGQPSPPSAGGGGVGVPSSGAGATAGAPNENPAAAGSGGGLGAAGSDGAAGASSGTDPGAAGTTAPACVAAPEVCDGQADEDCDGLADASDPDCQCIDGAMEACEAGKGICAEGTKLCTQGMWGECVAKQQPKAEVCDGQPLDEDCDGDNDTGCACTTGESRTCTNSDCVPGNQTCQNGQWSECTGRVTCGFNEMCSSGACLPRCNAVLCSATGTKCQPKTCDNSTGQCVNGAPAPSSTTCNGEDGVSVGYCEGGRCQSDTEIVCDVGGPGATQWLFPEEGGTCQPNNCLLPGDKPVQFGNCKTTKSGQAVEWELFNDGENASGRPTMTVSMQGRDNACGAPGCFKWFGNPHIKDGGQPVACYLFDDGRTMTVGPSRQFLGSWRGMGHPANPDGRNDATVCTPEQCRKWVGDCRVQ